MADINKTAAWVTARLTELGNATNDGTNVLITDANISSYDAGGIAGQLSVAEGGTGASTAAGARTNLDVPSTNEVSNAIAVETTRAEGIEATKVDKDTNAVLGNIPKYVSGGNLEDSGMALSTIATKTELGTKVDKDTDAVVGNLPTYDANGNLSDSGTALSSLMPKDTDAVSGNVAVFDTNHNAVDSGVALDDVFC